MPGNPFNLEEEKPYSAELYFNLLSEMKGVRFVTQTDHIVLNSPHTSYTIIYDALMQDEYGEPEVFDIFLPAITSYILWKKTFQKKFEAAMSGRQAYYILRDQEIALKREYEDHIVNARAKMRFMEVDKKYGTNEPRRPDDYHEHTQ